jgi:tetratricopeptide (TPR) repeat protein
MGTIEMRLVLFALLIGASTIASAQQIGPLTDPRLINPGMWSGMWSVDFDRVRDKDFVAEDFHLGTFETRALRQFQDAIKAREPGAIETARRNAEAATYSRDAQYILGTLYLRLAEQKDDDRLRRVAVNRMLGSAKVPLDMLPTVYKLQGLVAARQNDWGKAESAFRKLVRVAPQTPEARAMLGRVRLARGNVEGAIPLYRQAVVLKQARGEPVPADWAAVIEGGR